MKERKKELMWAVGFFMMATLLGLYACFGKISFGDILLPDMKQFCAAWSLCGVLCGFALLIGNQRLNDWINPRLDARSKAREENKKRRQAIQAELDLKDPDRIKRREKRKDRLDLVLAWVILIISPPLAIIVSVVLAICFRTEKNCIAIAICVLYAAQIWGLLSKSYSEMKSEEKE